MTPVSHSRGFALVGVLILLLGVAALSVLLVERTGPEVSYLADLERADRLEYALEAGTGHALWDLQRNRSCANYAAPGVQTFAGIKYSATVAPASGSPVTVEVRAVADGGDLRTARLANVRSYAAPEALVIVSTPEDKDTEIEGADGKQDHNHWDRDELELQATGGDDDRILMQLPVPEFQRGIRVETATLTLHVTKYNNSVVKVQARRVTQSWDEEDANWVRRDAGFFGLDPEWNTPGGDATDEGLAEVEVTGEGPVEFDVSAIVQAWAEGNDNHGFLIRAVPAGNDARLDIATGQTTDATKRPVLNIEYACECGSSCAPAPADPIGAMLSFAESVSVSSTTHAPGDVFDLDPVSGQSTPIFVGGDFLSPRTAVIDAVHQLADDRFLISTADSVIVDGQTFGRDQVFELNIATGEASAYWTNAGLTPLMSIDAIAVRPDGRLAFSVSRSGTIRGMAIEPHDVALFNPAVDGVAKWLEGVDLISGATGNVDALHVFGNGNVALSTDANETIKGIATGPDDLVLYDPDTESADAFLINGPVAAVSGDARLNAATFRLAVEPAVGDSLADAAAQGNDCKADYRDTFLFTDYARNDGTVDFNDAWEEGGESDGPSGGDVRISSDQGDSRLRLRDNDRSLERAMDLTIATRAELTFDYRRDSLDNSDDFVTVEISTNDGGRWDEVARLSGPDNDSTYQTENVNLAAYRTANTLIRFATSGALGSFDTVYIDNVAISVGGCP